jgi:hypothetical protein
MRWNFISNGCLLGVVLFRVLEPMRNRLAILLLLLLPAGLFAQTGYFPEEVFNDPGGVSSWYAYQLRVMGEPSLFDLAENPSAESYRFLWLRSFDPPVVVRLDVNADGSGAVTTKIADGQSGSPLTDGKVVEIDRRVLTREQVQAFAAQVDKLDFWSLATDEEQPNGVVRVDGSEWVIEAVRDGMYQVVARWSPDGNPSPGSKAVLEIGKTLAIDLAQLKIPKGKMY